jgi:insertion element IS1 protein InsB
MKCIILSSQKNQLWIWKAYCRTTGQLIDWECGDRTSATFEKMLNRLRKFNVKIYYADFYEVYNQLIPNNQLWQTKKHTWGIENNNGRQRHWFARFRRRTCVVSRCPKMVNLTISLFAKLHVNNPKHKLFDLFYSS